MKKKYFALLLLTIFSSFVSGQSAESDAKTQQEIGKLKFLEGEWIGSGWVYGSDSIKQTFNQTENISIKLNQTLILIESKGILDRKISHEALAVISYDIEKKHFNFRSYMTNGMSGVFKAELIENTLYWYPDEATRFSVCLNKKGHCCSKGEIKRGEHWKPFFDMTLYRKDRYLLF